MSTVSGDPSQLAAGFPTPTKDDWMRTVRTVVLKGKPDATDEDFAEAFARQLVHRTEDGIEIQPLYTATDAPGDAGLPGFAPFVRSAHAGPVPWEIRQRVWPDVDGSKGVTELESGATGVLVELPADADAAVLEQALDGVFLDLAPVSVAGPRTDDGIDAAMLLVDLWDRRGIAADSRAGTLGVDPLGAWARSGGTTDLDAGFAAAAKLVDDVADSAPHARVIVADSTVWHDTGATVAQELAWTIAAATTTVRALTDAGVSVERAFGTIEFRWAATADQFTTIAKLRAARRLWARVGEVAGLEPEARAMYQHAEGSRAMISRYDPWVNALRSTVACFGAAMGGADAITILPHDILRAHGGSALGRRVARNTQTVLQSESNLARVVDPAGGSWYVEQLTDELAHAAWPLLQSVESAGGIADALRTGVVEQVLDDARADRTRRLATRKRPLTGVSEFPDISEEPPPPLAPSDELTATDFTPLELHRLGDEFEAQRGRADAHLRSTGTRPTVYLATIGSPAAFTPRLTFASNLLAVAGIATIVGQPPGLASADTTVACLCSSDAEYREHGAAAVDELRDAGAETVYLAGRGLGLDGVDEEVGVGSDILDVLTRALDQLGVDR